MNRPTTEPQVKFLVPLERTITKIRDWNKHAVRHMIIPLRDLESLIVSWRKESHQWAKFETRIQDHLVQGVDICLDSLKPFLNKPHKKVEALVVPFLLFCHNAFIGDFNERMNKVKEIAALLQFDEKIVSKHLNTVISFYEHFHEQIKERKKRAVKDLKMKFDVQIKANKRLYEESNIDNHFKSANNIVRESTTKLEEMSLSYARSHFKFQNDAKVDHYNLEIPGKAKIDVLNEESNISDEVAIPKNRFTSKLQQSITKVSLYNWETLESWQDNALELIDEISKTAPKKLTFHVVKTKAKTGIVTPMEDMGLSKFRGAKLDIQLFKVLQFVPVSKESKSCTKSLFKLLFTFDQLSSSLLLPTKSKSKSFAYCRYGQDLLSHGILLQIKLLRQLTSDLDFGNSAWHCLENLCNKSNENDSLQAEDFADIFVKTKSCLNVIEEKVENGASPRLKVALTDILQLAQSKRLRKNNVSEFMTKLEENDSLHPALLSGIKDLKQTLQSLLNASPSHIKCSSRIQDKFNSIVKNELKTRCLIAQTVIKRIKTITEEMPFDKVVDNVIDCLRILDIETFQLCLTQLAFMHQEFQGLDLSLLEQQLPIFQSYVSLWRAIYNLAWNVYNRYSMFLTSTTQAFKLILEYDYMESKDDEEQNDKDGETQDDGKTQDGCGLGDGDAGQATTSDVTSEDMFDSAEKPQQQNENEQKDQDEQEESQMPPKEEDGFDVDNVEDENPQEKEEPDEGNNR